MEWGKPPPPNKILNEVFSMNKKEQQIIDMMKALDISREEAEELVAFDNEEFELEEVNEMTEKAKKADKGTRNIW